MDHIYLDDVAVFAPSPGTPSLRSYARRTTHGAAPYKAAIMPTAHALAEAGSANCCFKLASTLKREPAVIAGLALRDGLATGYLPVPWTTLLTRIGTGSASLVRELARIGSQGEYGSSSCPRSLPINVVLEQTPNPNSRILLSEQRDRLERQVPLVDWRLSDVDRTGWVAVLAKLGAAINQSGSGQLLRSAELPTDVFTRRRPACHHMGTTRMSTEATGGVVDRNCRVHDVGNLFVAGGSVFPTSGHANPVLTSVTLAIRLAHHVRSLQQ